MRILLLFWLLVVILLVGGGNFSSVVKGDETLEMPSSRIDLITTGYATAMLECPYLIWPDYDWNEIRVVFTDSRTKQAMALQVDANGQTSLETLAIQNLQPSLTNSTYSFGVDNGQRYMSLALDRIAANGGLSRRLDKIDYATSLGIHEGFHFFRQSQWLVNREMVLTARNTAYPLETAPRYYRYRISKALLDYLDNRDESSLRYARYWYDLYVNGFRSEADAIYETDRREGSALYVELVGSAIARAGCGVSENQILADAHSTLRSSVDIFSRADEESYYIGALAGLINRYRYQFGWEKAVENGATPLDTLLLGFQPLVDPDQTTALGASHALITERNQLIKLQVDPYLERAKSHDYYSVVIGLHQMLGSFHTSGFYTISENKMHLILGFEATFRDQSTDGRIVVKSQPVELIGRQMNPCGIDGYRFFLPKSEVNQWLTMQSVAMDNRIWICL